MIGEFKLLNLKPHRHPVPELRKFIATHTCTHTHTHTHTEKSKYVQTTAESRHVIISVKRNAINGHKSNFLLVILVLK